MSMQMDAYMKKEQINTLFVRVGALGDGYWGGGGSRAPKPKNRVDVHYFFLAPPATPLKNGKKHMWTHTHTHTTGYLGLNHEQLGHLPWGPNSEDGQGPGHIAYALCAKLGAHLPAVTRAAV